MTFDCVHADRFGEIRVRYCGGNFVVGKDNPLVKLRSRFGRPAFGGFRASPDDVDLDTITALGLTGNTHLVDCSSDDPLRYVFDFYGTKSRVEARRNFQHCRIREAAWPALREFGAFDYSRIKAAGETDLVEVQYVRNGRRTAYRRLTIPLASHGRDVSHLLVAMIMLEIEVPLRSCEPAGAGTPSRKSQQTVDP